MSGATLLDDILVKLKALPKDQQEAVKREAMKATAHLQWVPNPGPQTEAVHNPADEIFFGGQAGGGKSSMLVGLAVTAHKRSILFRREYGQVVGLEDEATRILGTRDGYNSQSKVWRLKDGRVLEFGAVQYEADKEKYKGRAHDLVGFDEIPDFLESQYTFLIGWNRSTEPGQRCRIVVTGNPPTRPEGMWVIKRWGAWLDPSHPNPAQPGELRWYTAVDGKDTEVDGPGPHLINGREVLARSRTFIPARLEDNIDLLKSGYAATLEAMPEPYRSAYRDGRFDVALKDDDLQLIPTAWIKAAQQRWKPEPPFGIPMCALGVDVAGGGDDSNVIAIRHDAWFAPLQAIPGSQTPVGTDIAGLIIAKRRDMATIVLDMGGGYGGATYSHLRANEIDVVAYKGAEASVARTTDGKLGFYNKRSQAWWRFREALDPGQPQGSPVALPDDPELVADLVAPHFEVGPRGIKVEAKEAVQERLGRSPDRGDAVVMAWYAGARAITHAQVWRKGQTTGYQRTPAVVTGREAARKNRSR